MLFGILAACVAAPFIGTLIGPLVVNKNMAWYRSLKHPSFTPPDWVFGPAWTALYCSMGAASYFVAREYAQQDVRLALAVYGINLLLNWSWTPVFFGMHRLKTSVAISVSMTIAALGSHYLFYKVNPTAGLLMVPYVLWLGYASYLNIGFARLNLPHTEKST